MIRTRIKSFIQSDLASAWYSVTSGYYDGEVI